MFPTSGTVLVKRLQLTRVDQSGKELSLSQTVPEAYALKIDFTHLLYYTLRNAIYKWKEFYISASMNPTFLKSSPSVS